MNSASPVSTRILWALMILALVGIFLIIHATCRNQGKQPAHPAGQEQPLQMFQYPPPPDRSALLPEEPQFDTSPHSTPGSSNDILL